MPKRQSTAAQKARQRQAETGEKYTRVLRGQQRPGRVLFRGFSAEGAGWAPITERASNRLREISPELHLSSWGEKFGELTWDWDRVRVPFDAIPREAWRVVHQAAREASVICQMCPSPGRKRVVWLWDADYGWVLPWVKTCCEGCYYLPPGVSLDDWAYRNLFETYEEPEPGPDDCCAALEDLASAVRARFDQGGMPALLAELEELRKSMWSRSPHHDALGGHAVVLAVQEACAPLMHRVWRAGFVSEPVLSAAERGQVLRAIDGMHRVLNAMVEEEHRG